MMLSLKRLNNLKQVIINEKQRIILDLTGKEKFQNLIFNERNKMHKFFQRYSNTNSFRESLKKSKESLFNKISSSFEELQRDKENQISKNICAIIEKNNILTKTSKFSQNKKSVKSNYLQ